MTFQDYEDTRLRQKPEYRKAVIFYRRVYNIPDGAESLIPARGEIIALRDEDTQTGINQYRVYNTTVAKQAKGGMKRVDAVFYRIRPYA
jgi:hypothetical protein